MLNPLLILVLPAIMLGQAKSEFQQILERLDRLENENRGLAAEVRALRQELAESRAKDGALPSPTTSVAANEPGPEAAPESTAPVDERLATAERRIEEQAQT